MSSLLHTTADNAFLQERCPNETTWEREVLPLLPAQLETSALLYGAMQRKTGKLTCASDLLRGILSYVLCAPSFRLLAAWGLVSQIGDLSDTSWRKRLRRAVPWLSWLLGQLLLPQQQAPSSWLRKAGYGSVELVDATHFKCVGLHGQTWRIHCLYDLLGQQLRQVVVTSNKVAENLRQFVLRAGSIYVHDSGYGYRDRVAQTHKAGAFTVTAFYPGSFPLHDEHGHAIKIVPWLKGRRACAGRMCERQAWFEHDGTTIEVRVIALRRTAEQTEKVVRRKRKQGGQHHRSLQPDTIYLAGWSLLLTTLPQCDWSAQEVVRLYQARWQIELLFKRIKQLLNQHTLRAETEETAVATTTAILISWMLQQEVAQEIHRSLSEMQQQLSEITDADEENAAAGENAALPLSAWRIHALTVNMLRHCVNGTWGRARLESCMQQLRRHLGERPRKRVHRWQQVHEWLQGVA